MKRFPRYYVLLPMLLHPVTLHAIVVGTANTQPNPAAPLVEKLLSMPSAAADPRGLRNPERWQLIRDIGATGDAGIAALQTAWPSAVTNLQRSEFTAALAAVHTPAGTKALLALADNPDDDIRGPALTGLAERVGRAPTDCGSDDILPLFAKLLPNEKIEANRIQMCIATRAVLQPYVPTDEEQAQRGADRERAERAALAARLQGAAAPNPEPKPIFNPDPQRVAIATALLRERLKNDPSANVRTEAACLLTDFGDNTGRAALKQAVLALQQNKEDEMKMMALARLTAAIEKVSGKTFGPVPMSPMLASDTRKVPDLKAKRAAILDALAAWAKEDAKLGG